MTPTPTALIKTSLIVYLYSKHLLVLVFITVVRERGITHGMKGCQVIPSGGPIELV